MAVRIKATTFRSYVAILGRDGHRDAVMAYVPPDTAALMRDPPLPGSWMDGRHVHDVLVAVDQIGGMGAVRDLARRGTEDARRPYMSIVEGVLKLFGTSPATLFKRMNDMVKSTIENLDYHYTPTTERSGVMEMTYGYAGEVPTCMFVGAAPALQTILDVCGVEGIVSAPVRLGPQKVRFTIQW